jgi:hypothetical protein
MRVKAKERLIRRTTALMAFAAVATFVSLPVSAAGFGAAAPQSWGPTNSSSQAAKSKPEIASGKVIPYNAILKLGLTSSTNSGPCPDGYANQCASGTCGCDEFSGTGSGSAFGKSSNVFAEISLDFGDQPGDPDATCFPAFGFFELDGTKDTGEVVDFVGAACNNFDGTSTFTGGFMFQHPSTVLFDGEGPAALGKFLPSGTFQFAFKGKARTN